MIQVEFDIVGVTPYSQSRPIDIPKETGETNEAFRNRTWKKHLHTNKDGYVVIPAMAVKNCMTDVAKFLSESVPGKGKATFTKHFEAGTMVLDDVVLNVKADDVQPEDLFLPGDGVRGSGKRVWKRYPRVDDWKGHVCVTVFDPTLESRPEKIEEYLRHAGKFIGFGRWRPRNGGVYGRFSVENFKVIKQIAA